MLTFLNATESTKWDKQQERRTIRSFAAKHSHKVAPRKWKKRKSTSAASATSASSRKLSLSDAESPQDDLSQGGVIKTEEGSAERVVQALSPPLTPHLPRSPRARTKHRQRLLGRRRESSVDSQSDTELQLQRVARGLYSQQLLNLDASRQCPFGSYPVPYHRWFSPIADSWYYRTLPKSQSRIKATAADLEDYRLWSQRLDMTDPAVFYTSLFMASGIPVAEGRLSLKSALWLRVQTVRALNQALNDPKRATSVGIILSVGRIALHEHVYGNRRLAHYVHRPAQQRMIKLAGGIESLDLPRFTIQLLVWADALMAAESGTPAYFANLSKDGKIKGYSQEEAMNVTRLCSPQRLNHPGYDKNTPTSDSQG